MKTKKELLLFVPKDKFDNYNIEFLYELSNDEIKLILPDLLIWLKDMNYPVSKELVNVLITRHEALNKIVNKILNDPLEDSIWKYNIINNIVRNFNKDDLKAYQKSLKRIVDTPSEFELDRDTTIVAKEILELIK